MFPSVPPPARLRFEARKVQEKPRVKALVGGEKSTHTGSGALKFNPA